MLWPAETSLPGPGSYLFGLAGSPNMRLWSPGVSFLVGLWGVLTACSRQSRPALAKRGTEASGRAVSQRLLFPWLGLWARVGNHCEHVRAQQGQSQARASRTQCIAAETHRHCPLLVAKVGQGHYVYLSGIPLLFHWKVV